MTYFNIVIQINPVSCRVNNKYSQISFLPSDANIHNNIKHFMYRNLISLMVRWWPNLRIQFLVGTLILLNSGCSYDFEVDSFYEVPEPENQASIEVENFLDGIVLTTSGVFVYKFEGNGVHDFWEVIFYIDDKPYYSKKAYWAQFPVNIEDLSEGQHILKLEYTFSSNSGSLGDFFGDESLTNIREYNFIVDQN
ncbi:hypothetical protein DHC50_04530 [Arenibacter sp. A80]|nr:hypothetical protein [Arenibacter sp. A80]RFT56903.1 hypothetical protein D0S24_04530 [Arenibacter sp. P308M17]